MATVQKSSIIAGTGTAATQSIAAATNTPLLAVGPAGYAQIAITATSCILGIFINGIQIGSHTFASNYESTLNFLLPSNSNISVTPDVGITCNYAFQIFQNS